ncbi:MAG: glycosyltransferase [Candidatus Aenigmarchaeota archaeon]|nr:glycosyltransferase [Candidatus Aenigmarchaeota archaeon]
MISIILPVYNAGKLLKNNMPDIIKKMNEIKKNTNENYEIIIIEESMDNTPIIAKSFTKIKNIRHIHNDKRLGKGGAIERGILNSRGDKIIFMDIDLSTDLSSLPRLIEGLYEYDIVVGSRFHPGSVAKRPFYRRFLGFGLSLLSRILFRIPVKDTQCGFKAFRKGAIRKIIKEVRNKAWLNYNVFHHTFLHFKNSLSLFLRGL